MSDSTREADSGVETVAETKPRHRGRRWLQLGLGLVLVVASSLLVQAAYLRIWSYYQSSISVVAELQMGLLEEATEDCLILGDSRGLMAIQPDTLESVLNDDSRWRNLSIYALPPMGAYLVLQRYTSRVRAPRRVLLSLSPYMMRSWLTVRQLTSNFPLEPREFGFLLEVNLEERLRRKWLLSSLFPTMAQPLQWERAEGMHAWKSKIAPLLKENRGYLPKESQSPVGPTDSLLRQWKGMRFSAASLHEEYLEKLLEMAEQKKVELYLTAPPVPQFLQELRDETGFNAQYAAWIQGYKKRFPSVCFLLEELRGYPEELFADPHHLNVAGARRFSRELALGIQAREAGRVIPQ